MKTCSCFIMLFLLVGFILNIPLLAADPPAPKVVLQGFWWDYWNNNYPNSWATYLADLAPRLREMGIDAVWIPPAYKNKTGTGSVGYSPFDHYDLGDKFQGNTTTTRFGNKDEYLRCVAILHANGIEVIQDMVWNHLDGAGSVTGAGGQDPTAWGNQWKNFRYVSYLTPATATDVNNYINRSGRFHKNWQNFHPNPDHNTEEGDWCQGFWGPDICYYSGAYGQSGLGGYDPPQSANYMRNGIREWVIWHKKQTDVDGYRLDAVKHFPFWATQDFLWNLKYNAGWANGGEGMFAVGEYVGSATELDNWISSVQYSNGGTEDLVGTFDFALRGAIYGMVSGNGGYNLGNIPGAQQANRYRTVPFVNNHDTFRPQLDGGGNYIGWNSGSELAAHIDPFDPRLSAAYAIALAVDGSPQIFFEDLFNIGGTGQRWIHDPTDPAQLPVRDDLVNLIWCHQKLNFKAGAYLVRAGEPDHLVIERSGRAVIGINDNWSAWQSTWVNTNFPQGTVLKDYSGASGHTLTVPADGRVQISTPPCNGIDTNGRRGYSVWAPTGTSGGFGPTPIPTTQEWEMADDLGDSHPNSLQQGGQLPANSTEPRQVGQIWPGNGHQIQIETYPQDAGEAYILKIYDSSNSLVYTSPGTTGNGNFSYTPVEEDWHLITVQNETTATDGQKIWVKATYTGPTSPVTPDIINFARSSFTLDERERNITLTVLRVGDVSGTLAVDYATSGGSAAAGEDYSAISGTVNFADGERSKTIIVSILNDNNPEETEDFAVNLSNIVGNGIFGWFAQASFTIIDTDQPGSGKALALDGVGDYLQSDWTLSVSDYTVSAWLKTTETTDWAGIISTDDSSGDFFQLVVSDAGKLKLEIHEGTNAKIYEGSTVINDGHWHHIAQSYAAASEIITIYVDGVAETLTPLVTGSFTDFSCNEELQIGCNREKSNFLAGTVDEVRVYDQVMSQADIRGEICLKLNSVPIGLVSYWNFDESSGNQVYDRFLDNLTGTINDLDGSADRVMSEVPLGDRSLSVFSPILNTEYDLSTENGDFVRVKVTAGSPISLHIYGVSEAPNVTTAPDLYANLINNLYWGVKLIGGGTYDLTYYYDGNPQITSENQYKLRLASRANNAATEWTDATNPSLLNIHDHWIGVTGQSGTEYAPGFGIQPTGIALESFTAQNAGDRLNRIEWITATESNTIGFQLQRSPLETGDFTIVAALIPALGSPLQGHGYSYTDSLSANMDECWYTLIEISATGHQTEFGPILAEMTLDSEICLPTTYELFQNYPNPFNPITTIQFALPQVDHVSLKIYNVTGQLVRILVDRPTERGWHGVRWDGRNDNGQIVSAGNYIYRLRTSDFKAQRMMVFLK